jgi:hypothetical protein
VTPSNEQINDWLKAAEASPEPRFLIFATLAAEWGAKQEREACAKACDGWMHANGNDCAAAIRARGEENKS